MEPITRRGFTQRTLGSLLTYSLLETMCAGELFGEDIKPIAAWWLNDVNRLCRDLKGEQLTQTQWQAKTAELFDKVHLKELLASIDFDRLAAGVKYPKLGPRSLRAKLPRVKGLPSEWVFGHQIFALQKGRSVVPHGHNNMATAFLVLDGKFAGRHYDRVEDQPKHMVIKPTIDRQFGPGEYTTVSDYKDNIHWFKAATDRGFIFNIHVLDVNPKSKLRTGRVYLDPDGEKLAGGMIRAPRMSGSAVKKKYG